MMMRVRTSITALCLAAACTEERRGASGRDAGAGIDTLNARIEQAYRAKDPRAYAALFTDSAVFEWPAVNTVRGRAGLEAMVRGGWPALDSMALELDVASRTIAADHATEHGAFRQSWRDSSGVRITEYGRYVHLLARDGDAWRIDRFFGFSDSTRPVVR